jgi:hypothetical protein
MLFALPATYHPEALHINKALLKCFNSAMKLDNSEEIINWLPESSKLMLEEGIPLDDVIKIVLVYGGIFLHIPVKVEVSSKLVELLGIELARVLVKKYPGLGFYIPKADGLKRYLRNINILQEYGSGKKIAEIALKHNLSDRSISKIIARHESEKYLP